MAATASLLDALDAAITPDVLSRVSALVGESDASTAKAFGGLLPTLLAGLLRKTEDPTSLGQLRSLLDDPAADAARVLGNPRAVLSEGSPLASRLLAWLFGDRTSGLESALAGFAGVRPSTASSLLSLGAPLLLSALRDRSRADGVDVQGLVRWLAGQRSAIGDAVPAALARAVEMPPRRPPMPEVRRESGRRGSPSWLWPVVGLLALAGLWALFRSPGTPQVATPASVSAPPPALAASRRTLPDGTSLDIAADRFESRLLALLEDPGRSLGADDWFELDRLLFATDSAALKPESQAQLRDVAAILRAYPSVRVKIGGYTDDQGDPAYNLRLSGERATNVMRELIALGIPASRLEAEGYGEQLPVASNATEAGRAQNRRIALRVVAR